MSGASPHCAPRCACVYALCWLGFWGFWAPSSAFVLNTRGLTVLPSFVVHVQVKPRNAPPSSMVSGSYTWAPLGIEATVRRGGGGPPTFHSFQGPAQ